MPLMVDRLADGVASAEQLLRGVGPSTTTAAAL